MTSHNRWSEPAMSIVEWAQDKLPDYVDREVMQAALNLPEFNKDGKPGVAALCCTPQAKVEMHPGPPYEYWVARALLVDLVESNERGRIVCTVLTSHGMKHDEDTPESVRIEFLTQVTRFVSAVMKDETDAG